MHICRIIAIHIHHSIRIPYCESVHWQVVSDTVTHIMTNAMKMPIYKKKVTAMTDVGLCHYFSYAAGKTELV